MFPQTAAKRENWPRTPTREELEDPNFVPIFNPRSRLEELYNGESAKYPSEKDNPDGNENRFSSMKAHIANVNPEKFLAVGESLAPLLAQLGRVRPLWRPVWP